MKVPPRLGEAGFVLPAPGVTKHSQTGAGGGAVRQPGS